MPTNLPAHQTFSELLESDFVTAETRRVLRERLDFDLNYPPQFLSGREYQTLKALCEALAPSQTVPTDFIAQEIDKRLTKDQGNGWRYDVMPPDGQSYKIALALFDEAAQQLFRNDFAPLINQQRIEVVRQMRVGDNSDIFTNASPKFSLAHLIEELLADFVEIFYSYPLALEEIGYIGFADAQGWNLGDAETLGQRDAARKLEAQQKASASPRLPISASSGETVDCVIVGTGAGGAPILARLAAAGLKVVALEAGKSFDYHAFATDEREQSKLFWTDERLSAGQNPLAFGNNNSGCGVGGSTLHFTAYTPRAQADDFQIFSEFGVGRDWPLPFAEIEKYYDELEWFLGVSGASDYPWGIRRQKGYPLPPLPLNEAAKIMQRGCSDLNIQTSPAANAALSQDYFRDEIGWRPKCTNRGFCQAGCSVGAKSSMDVTFLPVALNNGAEIRSECFVTGFEFDSNKQIKAVVYVQNGETKKQLCKNVFLCAGAIETPRLLLINDLANSSGQVGRNFMAHPGVQVWGVFDEAIFPHKGIPGGLISEETHRPQSKFKADFAGGYLLQSIGVMPVTYVSQLARGEKLFGDEIGQWMQNYNHTAGINILGDCLPYENNFLELADEKDARGLPKPRIYFTNGENENRMNAHAEKLMREIWTAAGAKKMWSFQRNAHIIGTCRMGADAVDSVVNQDCQSFDIANLYICDNSVFPSALAVNPSLTIMALALRTADAFLKKN